MHKQNLHELEQLLVQLHELLLTEREALKAHNSADVKALASKKAEVCSLLNQQRFADVLQPSIQLEPVEDSALSHPATAPELMTQPHTTTESVVADSDLENKRLAVVELAQQVQQDNLVNGKIMRRSQRALGELIDILSGKPDQGLYDTSGQTISTSQHSAAIAKA